MIKDTLLKLIFTPLLGIAISLSSGMISFEKYSTLEIIGALSFFIFVSYAIWKGCFLIHARLRRSFTVDQNPFSKISIVCFCSGSYSSVTSGLLIFIWLNFSKEHFSWQPVWNFISLSLLAVVIFTLVYEILVENAIKHNQFSEECPLVISIRMKDDYITVVNNLNSKKYPASSTRIGLKNLSSQYHLFCNKRVFIENTVERFVGKLPLIKQQLTC